MNKFSLPNFYKTHAFPNLISTISFNLSVSSSVWSCSNNSNLVTTLRNNSADFIVLICSGAERMRTKMKLFASEILNHEDLSKLLVDKGLGKLKYPLQNIWYLFDMKDSKFFIRTNVPFVNFALELLSGSLQVSIVFPNFEAIDQLRDVLNSKEEDIIKKFKEVIEVEILNLTNHEFLIKTAKDREEDVSKIPTFKIKIFNRLSIMRGNERWIPRNELTLDTYTIQDAYWFNFLKSNLNLYHPAKDRKPHWGAGVTILKQYRRGSEILTQPKKLIVDIQTTLQRFIDFTEALI